jgi:hypothetical protein
LIGRRARTSVTEALTWVFWRLGVPDRLRRHPWRSTAWPVRPGATIAGPALVQSRFTTIVLASDDEARMLPGGDVLVEVAPG